jgi:DNA gyrase subunit A
METIGTVRLVNINEEMRGSYLDYAMSVIVSRALPDARDGLKPVHRRILFAMYDMGVRPGTPYKKSARIVGEVLGKYHPHGDSAVYDAMARMAQTFSLRYPLVDGQGNFGSIDGDSPAAMRYTEARLMSMSMDMLTDINMNTVDFVENYDGTQEEPTVLPARLPNLLLNGANGIAVGMATSIPPHNLRELAAAITYLIDNYETMDDITVDDLMQFVKGPDFPTGATIIVSDDLKEAYATGKGRVAIRAESEIEETKNGGFRLVFTSIPYQVGKTSIVERIVSLVREGRIDGIRDLRDESDRDGLRMVVELKQRANPQTVLNQLYKFTSLQSFYSIQMLALVNNEPRTLSLKRCLQLYIGHRYEVIVRRSEYELDKLRARLHILSGLLKAVTNIDLVIQTIRSSPDVDTARIQLMNRFELSEVQAVAILDMQLRRLAALERQKLQEEYDQVQERISYLEDLLSSPQKIRDVIRADITEVAEEYGDERNTAVEIGMADFDEVDLVRQEQVILTLTTKGYIKRVPAREYRAQRRGGKGVIGMMRKDEDTLMDVFSANNRDSLLFFTNKGKVYQEYAFKIPETGRANKGTLVHSVLNLDADEYVTALMPISDFDLEEAYLILATRQGRIKRLPLKEFEQVRPSGLIAIGLADDDTLGWVKYTTGKQDVLLVTHQGQGIRFPETDVRVMGRPASGVNGIRLQEGDFITGMDVVREEHTHVLVVTQRGFGKRTPLDQYLLQSRYGTGARTLGKNKRTGPIVAARCIEGGDEIMLITANGVVLRTSLGEIRESGRTTQGVKLMNLGGDDEVVGIALMSAEEIAQEEQDAVLSAVDEMGDIDVLDDVDGDGDGIADASRNGNSASDHVDDNTARDD